MPTTNSLTYISQNADYESIIVRVLYFFLQDGDWRTENVHLKKVGDRL